MSKVAKFVLPRADGVFVHGEDGRTLEVEIPEGTIRFKNVIVEAMRAVLINTADDRAAIFSVDGVGYIDLRVIAREGNTCTLQAFRDPTMVPPPQSDSRVWWKRL